jgi:hypothetical protein
MIFVLAEWHAFAKLRVHTDSTLSAFKSCTALLGKHIRKFAKTTCEEWTTHELPRERAARARREATNGNAETAADSRPRGRKVKKYNMSTSKLHHLGHVPGAIPRKGTTDNYNTQTVRTRSTCRRTKPHSIRILVRTGASSRKAVLPADEPSEISGTDRKAHQARALTSQHPPGSNQWEARWQASRGWAATQQY